MRAKTNARAGFTLIELLVVLAIIGILAATFVTSSMSAYETAQIARATAESRELGNAIRLFLLTEFDSSDDSAVEGSDPLGELGLSEGTGEISSALTSNLTTRNNDAGYAYYQANQDSLRNGRIVDPWGNPYVIRVRKVDVESDSDVQDEAYEIVLPIQGRHRALEPLNSGSAN